MLFGFTPLSKLLHLKIRSNKLRLLTSFFQFAANVFFLCIHIMSIYSSLYCNNFNTHIHLLLMQSFTAQWRCVNGSSELKRNS
jgi:hypothetical protein